MTDAMRLLESWVADHQASVYRAAVMILRDEHAAQDVAQETFIRAYRAADRLGPNPNVRAWLARIATNLALTHLRSKGRERTAFERLGQAPELSDDPADHQARRNDVAGALARLPDRLRAAVVLRYYLDLPEREIANALGVAPGTVKSRLHEARALLAADPALDDHPKEVDAT